MGETESRGKRENTQINLSFNLFPEALTVISSSIFIAAIDIYYAINVLLLIH